MYKHIHQLSNVKYKREESKTLDISREIINYGGLNSQVDDPIKKS
jgi:hypothetical protein